MIYAKRDISVILIDQVSCIKLVKIVNKDGGDISVPWPLDVNGLKLPDPIVQADVIYLGFGTKINTAFAPLGLPETFVHGLT